MCQNFILKVTILIFVSISILAFLGTYFGTIMEQSNLSKYQEIRGFKAKGQSEAEYGKIIKLFGSKHHIELNINETLLKTLKTILFYNPFYSQKDFYFGFGQKPFIDANCKVSNCYTTDDKELFANVNQFDAVIFHPVYYPDGHIPNQTERTSVQRYVFYIVESPMFGFSNFLLSKDAFFNWTATYRWDSDFRLPYGWISPKFEDTVVGPPDNRNHIDLDFNYGNVSLIHEIASSMSMNHHPQRTKLVAWMVSHSHTSSKREIYVKELQKFVNVDVFGLWTTHAIQCPKDIDQQCLNIIHKKYKFYLSFENALCDDYVTEKFFKILPFDVVPIVYGGANYSKLAPNKSFINVQDFQSPKDLADYLQYLDKNATAYAEYFEWKQHFKVNFYHNFFCDLCKALNDEAMPDKTYENMTQWWMDKSNCKTDVTFDWEQ